MSAYYNEIDPYAAEWLRNLIAAGHIADGVVDTRSIEDVQPDDLRDFTQCHFFAGVGVWSHALRAAGCPDDRPVWTGSCPCQPFSAAGQGAGFADERHLWPAFHHLIKELRPTAVLGEQVASSHIDPWIDLVHADLEALGYTFGAVPFPSAGVGAPHIRDRLYWVAHSGRGGDRPQAAAADHRESKGDGPADRAGGRGVLPGRLADAHGGHAGAEREQCGGQQRQQPENGSGLRVDDSLGVRFDQGGADHGSDERLVTGAADQGCWMADSELQQRQGSAPSGDVPGGRQQKSAALAGLRGDLRPGPTNGLWRDADWLGCTDGKWRPVEPGTFPLAHGAASRVGRLRAYGNAINAEAARVWIEAVMGTV